jgi:hypothetical protein
MYNSILPLAALLSLTNAIYTLAKDFYASSIDFFDNFRFWHEGPDPPMALQKHLLPLPLSTLTYQSNTSTAKPPTLPA